MRAASACSTSASAPEAVTVWIGGHMEDCVLFDKCRPSLTSPDRHGLKGASVCTSTYMCPSIWVSIEEASKWPRPRTARGQGCEA